MIDSTIEFGRRAEQRLRSEEIIWLTTVSPKGQPQSVPVWFLWDGQSVLIYSQPNQAKLRNIEQNPQVALNLNSDFRGNDVVRIEGNAEIVANAPVATEVPAMIEKYGEAIKRIGYTEDQFAQGYSVAIRVTPKKIRGF